MAARPLIPCVEPDLSVLWTTEGRARACGRPARLVGTELIVGISWWMKIRPWGYLTTMPLFRR